MPIQRGASRLCVVALAALLLATVSCASQAPPQPSPSVLAPIDQATVTAVTTALKSDGELAGEAIRVRTDGTAVVLEGAVQTAEEKERAQKIASQTRGVQKVDNRLVVAPGH